MSKHRPILPGFGKRKRLKRIRVTDWNLPHAAPSPRPMRDIEEARRRAVPNHMGAK